MKCQHTEGMKWQQPLVVGQVSAYYNDGKLRFVVADCRKRKRKAFSSRLQEWKLKTVLGTVRMEKLRLVVTDCRKRKRKAYSSRLQEWKTESCFRDCKNGKPKTVVAGCRNGKLKTVVADCRNGKLKTVVADRKNRKLKTVVGECRNEILSLLILQYLATVFLFLSSNSVYVIQG